MRFRTHWWGVRRRRNVPHRERETENLIGDSFPFPFPVVYVYVYVYIYIYVYVYIYLFWVF